MICFGIPPLAGWYYLGSDLAILPPFLLYLLCDFLRYPLLLIVVEEDGAAVLSAGIWTLPVQRGRIVHFVEEFEELPIGHLFGVNHGGPSPAQGLQLGTQHPLSELLVLRAARLVALLPRDGAVRRAARLVPGQPPSGAPLLPVDATIAVAPASWFFLFLHGAILLGLTRHVHRGPGDFQHAV